MNLLLDTHVVLWSLSGNPRLKPNIVDILEDEESVLFVSSITAWEICILQEKKRINIKTDDVSKFIKKYFKKIPYIELPVTTEIAIQSRLINLPQADPADRFIAATALVHDLTLVSFDKQFRINEELNLLY